MTLAKVCHLWVIVEEEKCKVDIEHYLSNLEADEHRPRFFYVKKRRNRALRKVWPPSYYRYYKKWHLEVEELARELHAFVDFDLVHQLTMVGFREPGYLWRLGVPFVWGPVGGMGLFPWQFLTHVGLYGAAYYLGYNIYNACQIKLLRRPKLAAKAAGSGVFFATPENAQTAKANWGVSGPVISEVGAPELNSVELTRREESEPLRVVWSGTHTPGKALNLGINAISLINADVQIELHVLGQGRCTKKWKRLARVRGVSNKCTFYGWVSRDDALEVMQRGHVVLITSLRDLTSTVTIEALALGLPVVCLDHCGFSEAVSSLCGIRIPIDSPVQVENGIAEALEYLYRNECDRLKLAAAALERSKRFAWEEKARRVCEIYSRRLSAEG